MRISLSIGIISAKTQGGIMITKYYKRTGTKDEKKKRESNEITMKREEKKTKIEHEQKVASYKESRYHNIELMSQEKEYKKTTQVLEDYLFLKQNSSENIGQLIEGYHEYFQTYGENMTPLGLRTFRKGILQTIKISQKQCSQEESLETDSKENTIFSIYAAYFNALFDNESDTELATTSMSSTLETDISFENMEKTKTKVKDLHNNIK